MKKVKIKLNNKDIIAELAITPEDMYKGLSDRENLSDNEGMLFIWKEETQPVMVMRDMNFDLDFISVDENNIVKSITSADKDSEEDIIFGNSRAILEVNKGVADDMKVGDAIEIDNIKPTIKFRGGGTTKNKNEMQVVGDIKFDIDKDKVSDGKLYLLDNDGKISMELEGNERIFSIKHTKELFDLTVKANKSGDDEDYDALGKRAKEILEIHDNQEPEYAENI